MKNFIFLMFLSMVAITTICSSCHLEDAYPVPPAGKPSDSSGNYVVPPTAGSDTNRASYGYVRVVVNVDSGSAHFSSQGSGKALLTALSLQRKNGSASFVLGSANATTGQTNATVSLVHAENAQLTLTSAGVWRLTFPQYSATDTLNQPYIKAVVINDSQRKVFDYRAYLIDNTTLDYLLPNFTGTLYITSVIFSFNATNVPIITLQP